MEASTVLLSLTGAEAEGLICSVCREVYRSPRLLPCLHSFCLRCLEDVSRVNGGRSFPCPDCNDVIAVPEGGCEAFRLNGYLQPRMLEAARNNSNFTMCSEPAHQTCPLEYLCVPCDRAICQKCKLTKHECHNETLDLYEAAVQRRARLELSKDRLEQAVNHLTKKRAAAYENLNAAKQKADELKAEIQAEANALVTRVLKARDAKLREIDGQSLAIEQKLSEEAYEIHQKIDQVIQLRQRVHHALGSSASHADVVTAEKEMRTGQGSEAQLGEMLSSYHCHVTSLRPGLRPDRSSCKDSDIDRCLGTIFMLTVPFDTAPEVVLPVYQCGLDGISRQVHSLNHVADDMIYISFGGELPDYAGEKSVCISNQGRVNKWEPVPTKHMNRKFTCMKFSTPQQVQSTYMVFSRETAYFLHAKGGVLMATTRKRLGMQTVRKIIVQSESPLQTKDAALFDVHCEKTVAFDATHDGQLFVFVEEKVDEQQEISEHRVLLFRRNQQESFTSYRPTNTPGFHPMDVCFWREGEQEKLLVADMYNDAVHVVSVSTNHCRFERFLAAGNSVLVRPMTFDVDWQNRVWIGCGNGRILRCEKSGAGQRMDEAAIGDDSSYTESVRTDSLDIINPSRSTNTMSRVSDDLVSLRRF